MLPQLMTSPYATVFPTQIEAFEVYLSRHYLSVVKSYKDLPDIYDSDANSLLYYYVDIVLDRQGISLKDMTQEEYQAFAAQCALSKEIQRFAKDVEKYYQTYRYTHINHLTPKDRLTPKGDGFSCVMS